MPLYTISHSTPLTFSQRDELAAAITQIHSTLFTTPTLFVNVSFTDASASHSYIGGKQRRGNHIQAHVRSGPSRTQRDWEELCARIQAAWDEIVGKGLPKVRRGEGAQGQEDLKLRSLILLGDIIGGLEAGLKLPPAGGDAEWLAENWDEFERRAAKGEGEFVDLVAEIKERGLLKRNEDTRTAQQRLEEALGWGDSA